jgi:hypothetical protein
MTTAFIALPPSRKGSDCARLSFAEKRKRGRRHHAALTHDFFARYCTPRSKTLQDAPAPGGWVWLLGQVSEPSASFNQAGNWLQWPVGQRDEPGRNQADEGAAQNIQGIVDANIDAGVASG